MKWAQKAHRSSWYVIYCGPGAEVTYTSFFHKLTRINFIPLRTDYPSGVSSRWTCVGWG